VLLGVVILGVLAALLTAGVLYQRVGAARNRREFAPPGSLIDVGGHRVHATCRGEGRPIVLLEAGIAASSLSWALVEPVVAGFTRVCAYDRAGFGWSEPPSCERTFDRIVLELSLLLETIGAREKYVLVGHSYGCFVVRAYAARHPDRVLGLVLVDPAIEWLIETPERARMLWGGRKLSRVGAVLAHLGVVRACLALLAGGSPGAPRRFVKVFGPTAARTLARLVGEVRKLPAALYPIVQAHWCQPKCFWAMRAHLRTLERDRVLIERERPPAAIPVTVISSGTQPPEQLAEHRKLAEASLGGRHVVATHSTHWVQFDEPGLIVLGIRQAVESARA
jgi:pimeloyl-ACP methyl ester carboxylesterase